MISLLLFLSLAHADIINPTPSPTPSVSPSPISTLVMDQTITLNSVKAQINQNYQNMIAVDNGIWTQLWANPLGLTAQQAFNSFGANAFQVHTIWGYLKAVCNNFRAGSITNVEPHTVTNNGNGTVTVGP